TQQQFLAHSSCIRDPRSRCLRPPVGAQNELHAFRSVILIIATTFPSLYACSFVSLLQVQAKFFLAVKVFPSCSIRSSPSAIWQTMAFSIGGPIVFDPGCIMRSRIETVLKPGLMDGVSLS